ncbi:MAG: efflux RND transporter periplasmic adaptor subunit [Rikenellaceae bacterium]|nr:efflux RND transporter periplasmic adaptor subunit [Rikenellaceae bacterium]
MNKKTIRWVSLALIALILIIYSIYSARMGDTGVDDTGSTGRSGARTLNVDAVVVNPAELTSNIRIMGDLLPDEEVQLIFETSGKITELKIDEGTFVKKGQLLARVNDAPLKAELKRYQAQLKLAEDRVYRQKTLYEQDAVSKEVYETAISELDQLKANIEYVNANLALTELRAPFDGKIGLRFVSEGAYVSTTTVIATLTKDSPLKLEFTIPDFYQSSVQNGTHVVFTPYNGDGTEYEATVYAVDSYVDTETRTLAVRALYHNHDRKFLPGSYVTVSVDLQEFPSALSIPGQALVPSMGKEQVFLYRWGKAQPVDVVTGIRTDTHIQILEGIQPGDTVVTTGILQIRTGMPLVIDNLIE